MRQISNHKAPTVTAALDHVFGHTPDGVAEMSVIMKTECIEVNRVGRLWPMAEICICCSGICKRLYTEANGSVWTCSNIEAVCRRLVLIAMPHKYMESLQLLHNAAKLYCRV